MADLRAALGQKVREVRIARGLSQEQLAERAAMHWTYVSGIERGSRNPGLNALAQLARALGLSLPELVTDLEPVSPRSPRRAKSAARR